MQDFVYFQINQGSKSFRYFGLKKDEWMPKQRFREQQFIALKYLEKMYVHDDVQISGKLF